MTKYVGYARVSTEDQELQLQTDALKKAGCKSRDIYIDRVSGAKEDRPGLKQCLSILESGDVLVVWRLDRLGRSMSHLIQIINSLLEKKIGFKTLSEGHIDTTSASGELQFHIFSSFAQYERRLIQERTKAGLDAARARGRLGGRKPMDPFNSKVLAAKKLHQDNNLSIKEICEKLAISSATLFRYLKI